MRTKEREQKINDIYNETLARRLKLRNYRSNLRENYAAQQIYASITGMSEDGELDDEDY